MLHKTDTTTSLAHRILIVLGTSVIVAGITVWALSFWRATHPIWTPLKTSMPVAAASGVQTNFFVNTDGPYVIVVQCKQSGVPPALASHFENWRVPGNIACDLRLEIRSKDAKYVASEIHDLRPYASTQKSFIFGLTNAFLPRHGELFIDFQNVSSLDALRLADPVLEVRLAPELLKTRMVQEAIARVIAIALSILGSCILVVAFWNRHGKRVAESPKA